MRKVRVEEVVADSVNRKLMTTRYWSQNYKYPIPGTRYRYSVSKTGPVCEPVNVFIPEQGTGRNATRTLYRDQTNCYDKKVI